MAKNNVIINSPYSIFGNFNASNLLLLNTHYQRPHGDLPDVCTEEDDEEPSTLDKLIEKAENASSNNEVAPTSESEDVDDGKCDAEPTESDKEDADSEQTEDNNVSPVMLNGEPV